MLATDRQPTCETRKVSQRTCIAMVQMSGLSNTCRSGQRNALTHRTKLTPSPPPPPSSPEPPTCPIHCRAEKGARLLTSPLIASRWPGKHLSSQKKHRLWSRVVDCGTPAMLYFHIDLPTSLTVPAVAILKHGLGNCKHAFAMRGSHPASTSFSRRSGIAQGIAAKFHLNLRL